MCQTKMIKGGCSQDRTWDCSLLIMDFSPGLLILCSLVCSGNKYCLLETSRQMVFAAFDICISLGFVLRNNENSQKLKECDVSLKVCLPA